MAQEFDLEAVEITNPTAEDFAWRFNGTLYSIKTGETKQFARPVAYHLAKHLSSKMISDEATASMTKKDIENPNAAIHVKVSQLHTYDTHERRIALFKILKDETRVVDVIKRYPIKGFIGDMSAYKAFVEKSASPVVV